MRAGWFPLRVVIEESLPVLSPGLANGHPLAASSQSSLCASASLESVLCIQLPFSYKVNQSD